MNPIHSILILGATGRTGQIVLHDALERGFRVTVLVRDPAKLNGHSHDPNLEVLRGDVLNYADVYNAIQGNDAVISALGRDGKKVEVLTQGTENIIKAFRQSEAKRLVCLSSFGAGSTHKLAGWQLRLMIRLRGLARSFEAKAEQELMLYRSPIDFTLVMAGTITDQTPAEEANVFSTDQASGQYPFAPAVSRETIAHFLLEQIGSTEWRRRTICVF